MHNHNFVRLLIIGIVLLFHTYCSPSSTPPKKNSSPPLGEAVYARYCVTCHGANGNAHVGGAALLGKSTLSAEETALTIAGGRGLMPPYKNLLSAADLQAVTQYVMQLR